MARPIKRGLDYFPLDCIQDDNLTFIEAKHGIEGFGIVIKLWQKIYRNEGYYMAWNEQSMYLFAREIGVNIEIISSVVNTCLLQSNGIFNQSLYSTYSILTSTGIQKRWLNIVKSSKRKDVEIDSKYNLLELTPVQTSFTPEETPLTPQESTQRKEKNNKVNYKIEEEKKEEESFLPQISPVPIGNSSVYSSMDDVEFICLNQSTVWLEHMTRKLSLKNLDDAKNWVIEFFDTMRASGQDKRDLNDARSHCYNWVKTQIEKEKSSGKKEKGKAEAVVDLYDASTQYWEKVKQDHLNNLNQ